MLERWLRAWCRLAHFKAWQDDSRLNPRAQDVVLVTRLRCARCHRIQAVGVRIHAAHPGVAAVRLR